MVYKARNDGGEHLRNRNATNTELGKRALIQPVCKNDGEMRFMDQLNWAYDDAVAAVSSPSTHHVLGDVCGLIY
jgi:hypothetical protein